MSFALFGCDIDILIEIIGRIINCKYTRYNNE